MGEYIKIIVSRTKLTKQEYRIVLDAYIRANTHWPNNPKKMSDVESKIYYEIRNKLIELGEVA